MQTTESDRRQIALAQEYFRRVDAGRADLTDLMTEDVEFYFPKFGIGRGKAAFGEFAAGVGRLRVGRTRLPYLLVLLFRNYSRGGRHHAWPDEKRSVLGGGGDPRRAILQCISVPGGPH